MREHEISQKAFRDIRYMVHLTSSTSYVLRPLWSSGLVDSDLGYYRGHSHKTSARRGQLKCEDNPDMLHDFDSDKGGGGIRNPDNLRTVYVNGPLNCLLGQMGIWQYRP